MKKKYILIIEQETNTANAYLLNKKGVCVASSSQTINPLQIPSNHVEYDPSKQIYAVRSSIINALNEANSKGTDIHGIGIVNATPSFLIWDKKTGRPITNIISSTCNRGLAICNNLSKIGVNETIKQISGLTLTPNHPAPQIKWLHDRDPEIKKSLSKKNTMIGTLDSWLLYNLTGKKQCLTDYTNASKTMLLDIKKQTWSTDLLIEFGIPKTCLPKIQFSSSKFGSTKGFLSIPDDVPILSLTTKSQANLYGLCGNSYQTALLSYDSPCSFLINTGQQPILDQELYNATILASSKEFRFGLDSQIDLPLFNSSWGSIEELNIYQKNVAEKIEAINPKSSIMILPIKQKKNTFITTTPTWKITGFNQYTTPMHLLKAYFEAIVFHIKKHQLALEDATHFHIKDIQTTGRLSENEFLTQFQTDMLQIPATTYQQPHPSAIGSALLIHKKDSFFSPKDISKLNKIKKNYPPFMNPISSFATYSEWVSQLDS
jgi:glycerol kinase